MAPSTGSFISTDLYALHNVVQNVQIIYPKELVISALRKYFSKDSRYHYVQDEFGFPKTPDHTDLPSTAGLKDNLTTRVYIGQEEREDVIFHPAILVKHQGSSFSPISMNENKEVVQYGLRLYVDDQGQQIELRVPQAFEFVGAWDISLSIDIITKSPYERDELAEVISMLFQSIVRDELTTAGLFIKNVKADGDSTEVYQNTSLYKKTISLDCRGEYHRLVPVDNVIELVNLCADFGILNNPYQSPSPNLQINYLFDLSDSLP